MNRLREKLLYLIRLLPEIHKEPLNSVIREQTTQLKNEQPWLVWLSGLSANLQTKRSLVRFPVRAYAWGCGLGPKRKALERQPHIDVSLPVFLPPLL